MKTFAVLVLLISSCLLISFNDAEAGGYSYSRGYNCNPSFSFGFYGGSFYPPYAHYGYYSPYSYYGHNPYYGYRPYYGYYGRPYSYGGYGYYGRPYSYGGGYGYHGRNYRYHRPYSYRSHRRYPRIQKPHSSRPSNPRPIRRR